MPLLAEAVAEPVDDPLQSTSLLVTVAVNNVGSVIVAVAVIVQLFASVTVTVYEPADNPLAVAVVDPVGHE